MNRLKLIFGLILLAASTGGCVTPIAVLSTHTVQSGPDTESDVVWLNIDHIVYRCANTQSGPVCHSVKAQQ